MKFNLKLLLGTAALSILTFGTITEAEANFIGRVYDKLDPWEFRGSYGRKQVRETRYHKHRLLEITSEFDDPIKITNIKVNRGNCGIMFSHNGVCHLNGDNHKVGGLMKIVV